MSFLEDNMSSPRGQLTLSQRTYFVDKPRLALGKRGVLPSVYLEAPKRQKRDRSRGEGLAPPRAQEGRPPPHPHWRGLAPPLSGKCSSFAPLRRESKS